MQRCFPKTFFIRMVLRYSSAKYLSVSNALFKSRCLIDEHNQLFMLDEGMDCEDDFLEDHVARPGEFHGVYLLYCLNTQFKGRTYIGYTVNPNRRINQHNGGVVKGGAWKTSGRGPWDMVLITHGFPNEIFALRFEWAWQHPKLTRRLTNVPGKSKSENAFQYCIRILSELLRVGPWNRLPLTIQWLKQQYVVPFPISKQPPLHMCFAYGPIISMKQSKGKKIQNEDISGHEYCTLCGKMHEDASTIVRCVKQDCNLKACLICLAIAFLGQDTQSAGSIIPIKGICPRCNSEGLWQDFVKGKKVLGLSTEDPEEMDHIETLI